jgi:hypothetical protein
MSAHGLVGGPVVAATLRGWCALETTSGSGRADAPRPAPTATPPTGDRIDVFGML